MSGGRSIDELRERHERLALHAEQSGERVRAMREDVDAARAAVKLAAKRLAEAESAATVAAAKSYSAYHALQDGIKAGTPTRSAAERRVAGKLNARFTRRDR